MTTCTKPVFHVRGWFVIRGITLQITDYMYVPWNYFSQMEIAHEPIKLGLTFLLRHIALCMTFHEIISSSSIVMTPDIKTRPRTDGLGNDSARTLVGRPSFVESFTLKLSRRGTLTFISSQFQINMSDLCRVIRKESLLVPILG